MDSFSKLLDEALEQTSGVSMDEFIKFSTALVTSTSVDKIPVAIERAMALSSGELASIVKQVQFTGDTKALEDAFVSKPEYAVQFVELGRKLLPEEDLLALVEEMRRKVHKSVPINMLGAGGGKNPCPECGKGKSVHHSDLVVDKFGNFEGNNGLLCDQCGTEFPYCDDCDEWYNAIDFCSYHGQCYDCHNCGDAEQSDGEEIYNAEGDYYNQGEDDEGHYDRG